MTMMAPKRSVNSVPSTLEALGDMPALTACLDNTVKEAPMQSLGSHGHVHVGRVPASTRVWLEKRDKQQRGRKDLKDHNIADGGRTSGRTSGRTTLHPQEEEDVVIADDFHSQSGGSSVEIRPDPEADADNDMERPSARRGRRHAIDLVGHLSENTRWDSRPPPNHEEVERLLTRLGMERALSRERKKVEAELGETESVGRQGCRTATRGQAWEEKANERAQRSWKLKAPGEQPLTFMLNINTHGVETESWDDADVAATSKADRAAEEKFWDRFFRHEVPRVRRKWSAAWWLKGCC